MRFYDLITTPTTADGVVLSTPSGNFPAKGKKKTHGLARQWTSFPNGKFDPGALDIVFDLQITPGHAPGGGTVISIHGIDLKDLRQAQNFQWSALSLYAGMFGGLPLSASQPKPGLLINGTVYGAFGNWQGTEQTLDLLVIPSAYTQENPGNIVFQWQVGQSFKDAITQTLKTAWPNSNITVIVDPGLTTDQDILHISPTANGLAHFVHEHTYNNSALGPNYPGVSIYFNGSDITVTDYSSSNGPVIGLKFNDLVGQPTWLDPPTLTINTIMRADIHVGSYISLPEGDVAGPGSVITSPNAANASYEIGGNTLNFSGIFIVTGLRAIGQFRGTGRDDWICVIQAVPANEYGDSYSGGG